MTERTWRFLKGELARRDIRDGEMLEGADGCRVKRLEGDSVRPSNSRTSSRFLWTRGIGLVASEVEVRRGEPVAIVVMRLSITLSFRTGDGSARISGEPGESRCDDMSMPFNASDLTSPS